jgi:hypothetical protein
MSINGYALSDDDCYAVAQHNSIEYLSLIDTSLSTDGLQSILMMPRLRWIFLESSEVRGSGGFRHGSSSSLDWIMCFDTLIPNSFGSFAARCSSLKRLQVTGTSIDDRFMMELGAHAAITDLSLSKTSITDQSLAVLIAMPSLRSVTLPGDKVSQDGVSKLRMLRPDLSIATHGTMEPQ